MTFGERLMALRKENGYSTRNEFAEKLGIPSTTLRNYETNAREPGHAFLIQVSKLLNVSIDYLLCTSEEKELVKSYDLKSSEYNHIKKYRFIDDFGRKTVNLVLDREVERVKIHENSILSFSNVDPEETVDLPLFYLPASAGTGAFLDSDDYELHRFPARKVPRGATFALRVRGDSMNPIFLDGDIVFVKQQPTLEDGQIGIFILNGEGFIKKFHTGEDGYTLISKNPEYDDIFINENDDIRIVGRVLRKYSS